MSYQNTLINRATQRRPVQQQQPAPIGANENEYRAPGSGPSYGQTYGLIALGILLVAAFALIVALAVANGNSNEPYVNMDLIVDVPNVLSTDMNKAFTRNPFGCRHGLGPPHRSSTPSNRQWPPSTPSKCTRS